LDAKTLEKLRKVWAMRSSERKGEVLAAENRAEHIVKAFGYALADVEGLLRAADAAQPAPQGRAGFRSYNMDERIMKTISARGAAPRRRNVQR
jgi:hypothetical protein